MNQKYDFPGLKLPFQFFRVYNRLNALRLWKKRNSEAMGLVRECSVRRTSGLLPMGIKIWLALGIHVFHDELCTNFLGRRPSGIDVADLIENNLTYLQVYSRRSRYDPCPLIRSHNLQGGSYLQDANESIGRRSEGHNEASYGDCLIGNSGLVPSLPPFSKYTHWLCILLGLIGMCFGIACLILNASPRGEA